MVTLVVVVFAILLQEKYLADGYKGHVQGSTDESDAGAAGGYLVAMTSLQEVPPGAVPELPAVPCRSCRRLPCCYALKPGSTAGGCAGAAGGSLVAMTSDQEVLPGAVPELPVVP